MKNKPKKITLALIKRHGWSCDEGRRRFNKMFPNGVTPTPELAIALGDRIAGFITWAGNNLLKGRYASAWLAQTTAAESVWASDRQAGNPHALRRYHVSRNLAFAHQWMLQTRKRGK